MENITIPSTQEIASAIMRKVDAYREALKSAPEGVEVKSTASLRSISKASGVAHDIAYRVERIANGEDGTFSYETVHLLGSWLDAETSRLSGAVIKS